MNPPSRTWWQPLLALLLVAGFVTAVAIYWARSISDGGEARDEFLAERATTLANEAQCDAVRDLYGLWLDTEPPATLDETRRLDTAAAAAAARHAEAFESGLSALAEDVVGNLWAIVSDYATEVAALAAGESDAVTVWTAIGDVHRANNAFKNANCL